MDRNEFRFTVEDLRPGHARLRELMAAIPPEAEARRPAPDVFSERENVRHLRDLEAGGYGVRLLRLLRETDPFLKNVPGDVPARERHYNARPSASALEKFARLRTANVERLQRLEQPNFERRGTLEGVGHVTLAGLVLMWRDHDRGHLDDIARMVK